MGNVMIVDDDREMGRLLRTLFELEGHQVRVVATYGEVLGALREARPDVLVMDVRLQGQETIGLLPLIRQDAELSDLPVVMASGMDRKRECMAGGADQFVMKPFLPDDLVRMIGELMEG